MFAMSSKFNKRELAKISDETIGFLSLIATISDRNKNLNSEVWTSVDHEFIDLVVIGSEKFFGDFDEHTSSLDGEEMNIAEALPRRMISKTRERFLSTAYSIPNNCVEFDLPIDKLTVLVQGLPFDSYEFMSALILLGFPRVCSLMNQDYQNVDSDTVDLSVIYPDYASEWTMILLEHNEPTSVMYHALLLELYKQKCEIIYYDKFSSNKIAEHPVVRTKIDEVVAASIAAFILDTRIPIPNSFLLSGTFRPDGERDPHLKVLRSLRNEFLNGEGMIHKLILRCRVRNNFAFRDSKRGSMIDMLYTLLISVGVRDYNILIGILKEQSATSKGFIDFILHVEPVNEEKARADNMDIMRAVRTMAIGMVQKSVSVRPIDSAKSASLEEACTHLKGLNSNNAKMRQLLGQIDVISTKITAMMK